MPWECIKCHRSYKTKDGTGNSGECVYYGLCDECSEELDKEPNKFKGFRVNYKKL